MSKKEKNKKRSLFIGIITLVTLIVGITIFLIYKNQTVKFDRDWQQVYFDYIKLDLIDDGKDENGKDVFLRPYIGLMKNPEVAFIEDDYKTPIMIIRGDLTSGTENPVCDQSISISFIKDIDGEQKAATHLYYSAKDIVYLYDIKTKEYNWYVKQESETTNTYTRIIDIIDASIANENIKDIEKQQKINSYIFYENMPNSEEFENLFIEISKLTTKYLAIKDKLDVSDLKELIINSSDKMKTYDEVLTTEVKENVEKELTAREEAAKKAEEEKKKAEEEAKKKAEEEAKKQATANLKVGPYTLAYGTYKSLIAETPVTITLNSDKTCNYVGADPHTGNGSYNTTGTYTVIYEDIYGYGDMDYGIRLKLNNGVTATFVVSSNNAFGSDWLGFTHN